MSRYAEELADQFPTTGYIKRHTIELKKIKAEECKKKDTGITKLYKTL